MPWSVYSLTSILPTGMQIEFIVKIYRDPTGVMPYQSLSGLSQSLLSLK
jgi:hypothetical protein